MESQLYPSKFRFALRLRISFFNSQYHQQSFNDPKYTQESANAKDFEAHFSIPGIASSLIELIPIDLLYTAENSLSIVFRVFDPESNQKRIVKIPKNNFYETEAEISTRIAHFDHSLKFFVLLNDKKVLNFK